MVWFLLPLWMIYFFFSGISFCWLNIPSEKTTWLGGDGSTSGLIEVYFTTQHATLSMAERSLSWHTHTACKAVAPACMLWRCRPSGRRTLLSVVLMHALKVAVPLECKVLLLTRVFEKRILSEDTLQDRRASGQAGRVPAPFRLLLVNR